MSAASQMPSVLDVPPFGGELGADLPPLTAGLEHIFCSGVDLSAGGFALDQFGDQHSKSCPSVLAGALCFSTMLQGKSENPVALRVERGDETL
jgi:hypothetical protein